MALMDMILEHAGAPALESIGQRFGLPPEMVAQAAQALSPELGQALAQRAQSGQLPPAPPPEADPGNDAAQQHGEDVLGHLFGSPGAAQNVAEGASARTGIDADTMQAMLPQLASLMAGAAHGQAQGGGGLGGLIGRLGL